MSFRNCLKLAYLSIDILCDLCYDVIVNERQEGSREMTQMTTKQVKSLEDSLSRKGWDIGKATDRQYVTKFVNGYGWKMADKSDAEIVTEFNRWMDAD